MRRVVVPAIAIVLLGAVVAVAGIGSGERSDPAEARGLAGLTKMQQRLVSGFARAALEGGGASSQQALAVAQQEPTNISGCPVNRRTNIRVNQDCVNHTDPDLQGRAQAQNETTIAQDPNNPAHLVAASNDYRRGDSSCLAYSSTDGGQTWRDTGAGPHNFTRGTAFGNKPRQYWQSAGDPAVAWDSKGNAYLSCLTFNRGSDVTQNPDLSSAFYVFRSTGTDGASWNFPGRPVAEFNDFEATGEIFLDKEYLTVDNHEGSPFQDRVYVTWTTFASDGTAYIFGAFSSDYGESFSPPRLVSRNSALCSNTLGAPTPRGACNTNQFSQPFTGPDGTLYVVWDNFNVTAPGDEDNRSQVLLARSTDGGRTFSRPVKVADFYELPDCVTYQNANPFFPCVPEKGESQNSIFRAGNYPSATVDPLDPDQIEVTLGSYINRHSNEENGCVPAGYNPDTLLPLYTGVKEPGACNNDIVVSRSTDGGLTFTGGTTDVRELPAVRNNDPRADQFFQWAASDRRGRLAVAYYDRTYGNDQTTGFSDVSLSGSRNGTDFATQRVTSSSMAPATQFDGGFFGDYIGVSAEGSTVHPIWTDTRDPNLLVCRDSAGEVTLPPSLCTTSAPNAAVANDQNAYTRRLAIPLP
jgi:hypothetical protein